MRLLRFLFLSTLTAAPALELARPFGSHMVLPRDRKIPLTGTAGAGGEVEIRFGGKTWTTRADDMGRWKLDLPPLPASAVPANLVIATGDRTLVLEDLLVGEVWLCSGQSNMDFPLARATGGKEEAASAAARTSIRLFNLAGAPTDARVYDPATLARLNPRDHFQGTWQRATEQSAAAFSAIAWWTGKAIHEKTGVPVGLVENAVGGSPTEAWLPLETVQADPDYHELLDSSWLDAEKLSPWARGRAKQNLGAHPEMSHPFQPGFLHESGVRDFAEFPFRGVLWYQGETNAEVDDPAWQVKVMTDLVCGWRSSLGDPDLPFYMVQLPRIGGSDPLRRHWPAYRKAQAEVGQRIKGVTVIATEDLGWDTPDVHPPDKKPVAERLADAVGKGR